MVSASCRAIGAINSAARRMGGAKRYPSIAFRGGDGFRAAPPILRTDSKTGSCDLPVGQISELAVQSPLQKYFRFHSPQIISTTLAIPAPRGAYRDRHVRT